MGGNLFQLERMPRADYLVVEDKVRAVLNARIGVKAYGIPRYYGNKPDFGDADVILSRADALATTTWQALQAQLIADLHITQHVQKHGLWSTVVDGLQVDFFLEPNADLVQAKVHFMSFNDLGNILGRLFRPFGLKYSEMGLYYVFRRHNDDSNNYKREFLVSRNWSQILSLVELNPQPWIDGFDTLVDMFDWVTASPYFRAASYTSPQSNIMKNRLKQRTTMRQFLAYLEERNMQAPGRPCCYKESEALQRIRNHFGVDLYPRVAAERQLEQDERIIKAKLNGHLVQAWCPDMPKQSLGKFMRAFHYHHPRARLVSMSVDEVQAAVQHQFATTTEQEWAHAARLWHEQRQQELQYQVAQI